MTKLFTIFDDDDSGSIDMEELAMAIALMTGDDLTEDEVRSMMIVADVDGEGDIDLLEFARLMGASSELLDRIARDFNLKNSKLKRWKGDHPAGVAS